MNGYNNYDQPFQDGNHGSNDNAYYYNQHQHTHPHFPHAQQYQYHQPLHQSPQQHLAHELQPPTQHAYQHQQAQGYGSSPVSQSQYVNNVQQFHANSGMLGQTQHHFPPPQQAYDHDRQLSPQQQSQYYPQQYQGSASFQQHKSNTPQVTVQINAHRQHVPAYDQAFGYNQHRPAQSLSSPSLQHHHVTASPQPHHQHAQLSAHLSPKAVHHVKETRMPTEDRSMIQDKSKSIPSENNRQHAVSNANLNDVQRRTPMQERGKDPPIYQQTLNQSRDPPQQFLTQDDIMNITRSPVLQQIEKPPTSAKPMNIVKSSSTASHNLVAEPQTPQHITKFDTTAPNPKSAIRDSDKMTKSEEKFPQPSLPRTSHAPSVYVQVPDLSSDSIPKSIPLNHRVLLLSIADQYLLEARSLAPMIALRKAKVQEREYFRLMATALSCIERVLKSQNFNLPPREEAALQLQYATLLYQETENFAEVESQLSRGISFCDRNRVQDFKYAMQHLLIRVLFRSKVKVAFKLLESVLAEAVSLNHIAWIYAFRFLRLTLSLGIANVQERSTALSHIREITNLSRQRGDNAVLAISAILEAMTCLQNGQADSVMEAHRAIATARAQQLDGLVTNVPQINAMVFQLDLICSLDPYYPTASREKLEALTRSLEGFLRTWRDDGLFSVPLKNQSSGSLVSDSGGVFVRDANGQIGLSFSWFGKTEVHILAYFLSALAMYYKTASNQKTEEFLTEGLKMAEDGYQNPQAYGKDSSVRISSRLLWLRTMRCYMLLTLAFAQCERSDWNAARSTISTLQFVSNEVFATVPNDLQCMTLYLSATLFQITGGFQQAMQIYTRHELSLPETGAHFSSHVHETLCVLSSLNLLLMMRPDSNPSHDLLRLMPSRLESYFQADSPASSTRANPHIQAFYQLTLATMHRPLRPQQTRSPSISTTSLIDSPNQSANSNSIIQFKSHLQKALHLSKSVHNSHILTICLAQMHSSFFEGIVGQQAVNAANAARATAKDAGSKLWTAVADGLGAETLTREGRIAEAEELWREGEGLTTKLGLSFPSERM